MIDILKNLNNSQKKAVTYNEGPLAIIAGAGSGKTKTIIHKIAYIIKNNNIKPHKILAVTFTNKATEEMKNRITKLIGKDGEKVQIYTYHALCAKILRIDIDKLNYDNRFNIIDSIDQNQILKVAYKKYGYSNKIIPYKKVIEYISIQKNLNKTPNELFDEATKDIDKAFVRLYEYYLEETKKSNNLDFDDLLFKVEELFKKHKNVAMNWSKKFQYVLVDEFQDTSKIQYNIIKQIANNSIFSVVGDPDQTIYTWRFADPKLILNFNKNYKNAHIVLLEENYRSTKTILNSANSLISNNKNRIEKNLFTSQKEGNEIDYHHAFSEDAEARWVVSKILDLNLKKVQLKDIAILYRSNYLTNSLEKILIDKNIRYFIYGGAKFYQREEIKDVVAYIKVISNGNATALKRIINVPARKIGPSSQDKIFNYLDKYGDNTFEIMQKKFLEIPITSLALNNLANFINLINKYKKALANNPISKVIEKFLIEIKYKEKWPSFEEQNRLDNIKEFIISIKNWEDQNPKKTLEDFINKISLYTDEDQLPKTDDFVKLMTIHSSKGLEFSNVFIFGMSEIVFPSKRALLSDNINALEEERRLAYVAVTRAKRRLFISSSRGYAVDYKNHKTPSRFIKELGINPKKYTGQYIPPKSFNDNFTNKNNFVEGDKVLHEIFGKGLVISLREDVVEIAFKSPHGVKTMMKNHKSIVRVGE